MKDTILYIDDEKENLDSFQLAFWSDYNLLLANNTKEAEEMLRSNDVKLVITDQKMADETGIEFINRIRPIYHEVIYVVLTAYAELDIVLDAINTGVYQFIQKPWEQKEMLQVIVNAIDKYNLQKQNKELLDELKVKNEELKDSNDELLSLARQFRERKRKSEQSERLLNTIFENLPHVVILLNAFGKTLKINKVGQQLSNNENNLPGNVLNCVNAFSDPNGCGYSDKCQDCMINNTIKNTLKYKTDYQKVVAEINISKEDASKKKNVIISTTYIELNEQLVLVNIEDVTNNNEIIALK